MDLTTLLSSLQEAANVFSALDVVLVIASSFLLSLFIGWVYKNTYQGFSYTQSYVHTLALMTMVVAVIMGFVIPVFQQMFADFDSALPLPTQIIIALSDFVQAYWIPIVGVLAFGIIVLKRYSKTEKGQRRFDALLLRIPVIGTLKLKVATSRFARNLGSMLSSGIELLTALSIVKNIIWPKRKKAMKNKLSNNHVL